MTLGRLFTWGRRLAALVIWAWTAYQAIRAILDEVPGPSSTLIGVDRETGLALRLRLTPAEIRAARDRERDTELLA